GCDRARGHLATGGAVCQLGHGSAGFRQRRARRHFHRPRRADSPDSAGALGVSQRRRHEVRRCVARGRAVFRGKERGAGRGVRRLRQRRQGGCFHRESGLPGLSVAQYFARGESLDYGETGGAQEQPRWHRGAGGGGGGRPAAAARAGGWVGLSVGQRSAPAFRVGRGGEGRKTDSDLAGRWQAGGGEPAGGPRDHHRGEVAVRKRHVPKAMCQPLPNGRGSDTASEPRPLGSGCRRLHWFFFHRPKRALIGTVVALALSASAADGPGAPRFPSPIELAVSKDGARLYALCEGTDEVVAYDARSAKIVRRIKVGRVPKGLALSPDGTRLYVANSWSDSVSEIDTASLEVVRSLPAGLEPNAVLTDLPGRFLYVANRVSNDVSVVDLAAGVEVKRLVGGRGASYLALSPDGASIYCTHIYPDVGEFRAPPQSEITVIDTARQTVTDHYRLPNAAGVFHVAMSADGRLGMAAQLRPKNLIPLAHVEHGWVFGNSISVFGPDANKAVGNDVGEVVQIPLDELDRYFTPPFAIAIAADKSVAYISTTGSDSVTVIDIAKMLEFIRAATPAERRTMANDLSASANYVVTRIPVGSAPKGLALSPDGKRLYVANRTDDTISVIDTAARKAIATLSLEGNATPTAERRGERLFFSARFAFQGHFGCANCHLESTFDALQWDLEPDGFGKDIVDNRLLEDVA